MASSRASTHMKEKSTTTHIGPDDPRRQRTTKTSVPSSPERDTAPPQNRPINRSTSDGADKTGKSTTPQQTSSAGAKSRLTVAAKKPGEKPPSPSRQPLKSSPATSAAAREKTVKPSTSAASRAATKPAISSDKATKTLKTAVKGRSSPSRRPVASRKPKETSSSADDDAARITTKSVEPVVTENTVVTENFNQNEEQDSAFIASPDIHIPAEHQDDICDENPKEVEETIKEIDDDHIEEKDQVSECEDHHESPKQDPDEIFDPCGSRVSDSGNQELSGDPPADTEESHKSPTAEPSKEFIIHEKIEDDAEETSLNNLPAAEPSKEFIIHEKIEDGAEETSLNNLPAAEPSTEKIVETKKITLPASAPFSKPAAVQEKKKEATVSNEVIEETRSKLLEKKKSKVSALVGAFETVISLQDDEGQSGQSQKST